MNGSYCKLSQSKNYHPANHKVKQSRYKYFPKSSRFSAISGIHSMSHKKHLFTTNLPLSLTSLQSSSLFLVHKSFSLLPLKYFLFSFLQVEKPAGLIYWAPTYFVFSFAFLLSHVFQKAQNIYFRLKMKDKVPYKVGLIFTLHFPHANYTGLYLW